MVPSPPPPGAPGEKAYDPAVKLPSGASRVMQLKRIRFLLVKAGVDAQSICTHKALFNTCNQPDCAFCKRGGVAPANIIQQVLKEAKGEG